MCNKLTTIIKTYFVIFKVTLVQRRKRKRCYAKSRVEMKRTSGVSQALISMCGKDWCDCYYPITGWA